MRITETDLRSIIKKQLTSILKEEQTYQSQPSGEHDKYGRPLSRMGGLTTDEPSQEAELQGQKTQTRGEEARQTLQKNYKVTNVNNALERLNRIMTASGPTQVVLQDALELLELVRAALSSNKSFPIG